MAFPFDWKYRKSHIINQTSGAGANYQVLIIVHYGNGTDYNENTKSPPEGHVYLNGKCRTDFGDIRFSDDDGKTELDYWMKEKVEGDYAVFWVEIKDDLSSAQAKIYCYYGKNDATTTSDIKKTSLFNHGDDFEDGVRDSDLWDVTKDGIGTVSEAEGKVKYYSLDIAAYGGYISNSFHPAHDLEIITKINNKNLHSAGLYINVEHHENWDPEAKGDFYCIALQNSDDTCYVKRKVSGVKITLYSDSWTDSENDLKIRVENGTISFFEGDAERFSQPYALDTRDIYFVFIARTASGFVGTDWFDYFFVRKFVDPEPTHGSWGSEETLKIILEESLSIIAKLSFSFSKKLNEKLELLGTLSTDWIHVPILVRETIYTTLKSRFYVKILKERIVAYLKEKLEN